MKIVRAVALLFVCLAATSVFASDWPQYLGLNRDATSDEKGLLRSWPAEGPKVLWTIPLGEGYGGPAVSQGKVYVYDWVDKKTGMLRCIDLVTGKEEWTFGYATTGSRGEYFGSKSVPTVDGGSIYFCDQFGLLTCVDKNSHKAVWQKNFWTDFGGTDMPDFEIAQSPLVFENLVIVASQTQGAGVVAYDKQTGNLAWKTAGLPGKVGYMSPLLVKIGGSDHVVMLSGAGMKMAGGGGPPSGGQGAGGAQGAAPGGGQGAPGAQGSAPPAGQGTPGGAQGAAPEGGQDAAIGPGDPPTIDETNKGALSGYDAKTGALLWSYSGFQSMRPISNVTSIGNNRFFLYGGDGGTAGVSAVIQIEKNGTSYSVKELQRPNDFGSAIHPVIFYKEHLYGNWTTLKTQNGMVCMDLTGTVKWKTKKNPLFERGGLILVDDMIINNGNGTFYLIEPSPDGFKVLSKAKLLNKKEEFAPFALSDGKLVVRGLTQMKCVVVK